MIFEPFSHPTDEQIEAAYKDGAANWNRPQRSNPYIVAGEPLSNPLAWAWDLGRRERQHVDAERAEKFEANRLAAARGGA